MKDLDLVPEMTDGASFLGLRSGDKILQKAENKWKAAIIYGIRFLGTSVQIWTIEEGKRSEVKFVCWMPKVEIPQIKLVELSKNQGSDFEKLSKELQEFSLKTREEGVEKFFSRAIEIGWYKSAK